MNNKDLSAETKADSSSDADVTLSSQTIANALVGSSEKYRNIPPKDIMNAIWGGCFDYKDFDKKVMGEPIRDRIYDAWQRIHQVVKGWIDADEKSFLNYIRKNEPDLGQ